MAARPSTGWDWGRLRSPRTPTDRSSTCTHSMMRGSTSSSVLQHAADHGLALAETLAFEQRGHLIEQVGNGKALRALLLAIHASRTERGIGGLPGEDSGGPNDIGEVR